MYYKMAVSLKGKPLNKNARDCYKPGRGLFLPLPYDFFVIELADSL